MTTIITAFFLTFGINPYSSSSDSSDIEKLKYRYESKKLEQAWSMILSNEMTYEPADKFTYYKYTAYIAKDLHKQSKSVNSEYLNFSYEHFIELAKSNDSTDRKSAEANIKFLLNSIYNSIIIIDKNADKTKSVSVFDEVDNKTFKIFSDYDWSLLEESALIGLLLKFNNESYNLITDKTAVVRFPENGLEIRVGLLNDISKKIYFELCDRGSQYCENEKLKLLFDND